MWIVTQFTGAVIIRMLLKKPLEEFQADLFYMKSKTDSDNDEYKIALGCIGRFSKYAVVIGMKNKQSDTLLEGLKQVF